MKLFPFNEASVDTAVDINTTLNRTRKQIDLPDLLTAATAITHSLSIETFNRKHFDRIDNLDVIE